MPFTFVRLPPLLAVIQPLGMQHAVDFTRANGRDAIAVLPRRPKPVGIVAAAEEAGPVPGGQCGGPVENSSVQLRVAITSRRRPRNLSTPCAKFHLTPINMLITIIL